MTVAKHQQVWMEASNMTSFLRLKVRILYQAYLPSVFDCQVTHSYAFGQTWPLFHAILDDARNCHGFEKGLHIKLLGSHWQVQKFRGIPYLKCDPATVVTLYHKVDDPEMYHSSSPNPSKTTA